MGSEPSTVGNLVAYQDESHKPDICPQSPSSPQSPSTPNSAHPRFPSVIVNSAHPKFCTPNSAHHVQTPSGVVDILATLDDIDELEIVDSPNIPSEFSFANINISSTLESKLEETLTTPTMTILKKSESTIQLAHTKIIDLTTPLSLPYSDGYVSLIQYYFNTFIVTHPRVQAFSILIREIASRVLVMFDIYTDAIVAYALYAGWERTWFMLSCLFLCLPFVLVWSGCLRYVHAWMHQRLFSQHQNINWAKHAAFNFFLLLYIFPPTGAAGVFFYEIYLLLVDIAKYFKAFLFGEITIDQEDRQENAFKSYRKAIEIFAESLPQSFLQLYIFLAVSQEKKGAASEYGIALDDLTLSLVVSLLNLCINFYQFRREATLHGMYVMEYALSVLQLAEVPIIKFVPRLPAIEKGLVEEVNFNAFKFDKASVTPLLESVYSNKCELKTIRLSVGSLSKLDIKSCKMLGYLLFNAGINVLVSCTACLLDIKHLFERIDKDNNGYLDIDEFFQALNILNCSLKMASKEEKTRIFQELAIRRIEQRDRIYFHDFFNHYTSVKSENNLSFDIDLTHIAYPLHYIFNEIKTKISLLINTNIVTLSSVNYEPKMETEIIFVKNMKKLYQLCDGLGLLNQIDPMQQQHALYDAIDAMYIQDDIENVDISDISRNISRNLNALQYINKYNVLLWTLFKDLIQSPSSKTKLLLKKNNNGYNIFEYCFMHKEEQRAKCKSFAFLFNSFIKKAKKDNIGFNSDTYLKNLISNGGELYDLFTETNGFDICDQYHKNVLFYVIENDLNEVFEYFMKYIIPYINENDQNYLHSIIMTLLSQSKIQINKLLMLLQTGKIDVNYCDENNMYLAHKILKHRKQLIGDKQKVYKKFIKNSNIVLTSLRILTEFNYDFSNNVDKDKNNVLHFAVLLNDEAAIRYIVNDLFNDKQILSDIFNAKNKQSWNVLESAINIQNYEIASFLWQSNKQTFDVKQLSSQFSCNTHKGNHNWINWIKYMLANHNDAFWNKLDQNSEQALLDFIYSLDEKSEYYVLHTVLQKAQQLQSEKVRKVLCIENS